MRKVWTELLGLVNATTVAHSKCGAVVAKLPPGAARDALRGAERHLIAAIHELDRAVAKLPPGAARDALRGAERHLIAAIHELDRAVAELRSESSDSDSDSSG